MLTSIRAKNERLRESRRKHSAALSLPLTKYITLNSINSTAIIYIPDKSIKANQR
jgi:hypothetical protein